MRKSLIPKVSGTWIVQGSYLERVYIALWPVRLLVQVLASKVQRFWKFGQVRTTFEVCYGLGGMDGLNTLHWSFMKCRSDILVCLACGWSFDHFGA